MPHSHMWHASLTHVTCLIHTCDMPHSHMWHASFTHVTFHTHQFHVFVYITANVHISYMLHMWHSPFLYRDLRHPYMDIATCKIYFAHVAFHTHLCDTSLRAIQLYTLLSLFGSLLCAYTCACVCARAHTLSLSLPLSRSLSLSLSLSPPLCPSLSLYPLPSVCLSVSLPQRAE